jgi:hypothetical protein
MPALFSKRLRSYGAFHYNRGCHRPWLLDFPNRKPGVPEPWRKNAVRSGRLQFSCFGEQQPMCVRTSARCRCGIRIERLSKCRGREDAQHSQGG